MNADQKDHTSSFMLRSTVGLLLAPPGPLPPHGPRIRGVVRPSVDRARIVLSDDPQLTTGIGLEFMLLDHGTPLNVDAAIDFARTAAAPLFRDQTFIVARVTDSHGNRVVEAESLGFTNEGEAFYDHSLFGILSLMVHGTAVSRSIAAGE